MSDEPHLLVVCGRNKKRSRTAEYIFKNDDRFDIRSAGLSPSSTRRISEGDLDWADLVIVMETDHRNRIQDAYGHLELPPIDVLDIPDEYEFMDAELVEMLRGRVNAAMKDEFGV